MNKKYLLFALALGILTACDPIKDEGDFVVDEFTSEQLLEGATFSQYTAVTNADGTITYTPSENGNYIEFNIPSVWRVIIYYVRNDAEVLLYNGISNGMFNFTPTRGSEPNQTVYFRFINQNGEETVASKNFTLTVAADLSPEMKLLASDSGSKVWKWYADAPDKQVWGNFGAGDFSGKDLALNGSGKWWGVTSEEEFMGQLNHTHDGQAHGDESFDATMVFNEDGTVVCYNAEGTAIRSGNYSISDYDPDYSSTSRYCGILNVTATQGAILWPYEINSGGNIPTHFYIAYLSPSRLVLVYPDGDSWGGEGSFWQFHSESDILGCLTDNSSATWTWDTSLGACWGNGGYAGAEGVDFANNCASQWWGVTSEEEFMGQLNHTHDGQAHGDESMDATMVFDAAGTITKYDGNGAQMASGLFSVTSNNGERKLHGDSGYEWELGTLTTTAGSILFPYAINTNGQQPTDFEVLKITDDQLVLVNTAQGTAAWSEMTFWRFKKVK